MAVTWLEIDGSPTVEHGRKGSRATRELMCAWGDAEALCAELMGDSFAIGGSSYAQFPGLPGLRVSTCTYKPAHDDQVTQALTDVESDLAGYESYALVTVQYEPLPTEERPELPEREDGTFLSYKMDFGTEFMQMPGQALVWANAPGIPVRNEALPTTRIVVIEHHLSWSRVIDPPWQTIQETSGCVNDNTGQVGADGDEWYFMNAGVETLLFDGCTAATEYTAIDEIGNPFQAWKLDYVFREKLIRAFNYIPGEGDAEVQAGWNHFWREFEPGGGQGGVWDRLVGPNGEYNHPLKNFWLLLQQASYQS